MAWGSNGAGQCNVPSPNTGFVAVAAGGSHSLGLKEDGSIVAWGRNDEGQRDRALTQHGLCRSSGRSKPQPRSQEADGTVRRMGLELRQTMSVRVPSPNIDFKAVVAGGVYQSLGLKGNGSIVAWGNNDFGECNVPSPNTGFAAIAVGSQFSLGLKQNGSIVAWGINLGECNVPSPNTSFVAIAAGGLHSLGLKEDGSIVTWGDSMDVPSPNTGFEAVAAGVDHSLGLKDDGSNVAWGWDIVNYKIPLPNSGFVAMAAGDSYSLGLKDDGS